VAVPRTFLKFHCPDLVTFKHEIAAMPENLEIMRISENFSNMEKFSPSAILANRSMGILSDYDGGNFGKGLEGATRLYFHKGVWSCDVAAPEVLILPSDPRSEIGTDVYLKLR